MIWLTYGTKRYTRLTHWHRKFIWWPLALPNGKTYWLMTLARKGTHHTPYVGETYSYWTWEYRPGNALWP